MFITNCWRKFRSCCSFKLLILSVVVVWLLNLLLFYYLKSLSYRQNTVHVLQSPLMFQEGDNNIKVTENVRKIVHAECKRSNFTIQTSKEILRFKDRLPTVYFAGVDFPRLSDKCIIFTQKLAAFFEIPQLKMNDNICFGRGKLINALKTAEILKVENALKGTQLKLLVHMTHNLKALVKPQWYSPFDMISGSVYAGKDRHYGEIFAFYLSVLLDMPRVPPVTSRKFDLPNEIISVADEKLLGTFLIKDNQTCFYGVCPYCNPSDLLCVNATILEGAVIYYLPPKLKLRLIRHPWRRTYRCNVFAKWEMEENYCNAVRNSKFYSKESNKELFLDLMDTAIFDFLISNGDRHHYEFVDSSEKPRILLLDNGKSFGNPYTDHMDILAPLYHCCILRNSTWNNLLLLRGGNLSKWLLYLMKNSDDVIVNKMNFKALDRRLILVFAAVEYCFAKRGSKNVIINNVHH